MYTFAAIDEATLAGLARSLAPVVRDGGVLHLAGELGAGKTTFARALLQALGVGERVKSPTYSLIESYRVDGLDIHHLDLYRIADAGELEWLGLPERWGPNALLLIEWPERAGAVLPPPDMLLQLQHAGPLRSLVMLPRSTRGQEWLACWPGSRGKESGPSLVTV